MSESAEEPGIVVNLVADFICPWCFIGSTRLDQAIDRAKAMFPMPQVRVAHAPFMLDEETPAEGRDLRAYLKSKYGADPDTMFVRVEQAAKESGIPLDFSKITRAPNTAKAHTLVQHALERGTQRALVRALYEAYFLQGKDIGQESVLVDLAEQHGFSRDEATTLMNDPKEVKETFQEAATAKAQGVTGVPFFVFDGRFGVSGAQRAEVLIEALKRSSVPQEPDAPTAKPPAVAN